MILMVTNIINISSIVILLTNIGYRGIKIGIKESIAVSFFFFIHVHDTIKLYC